jgi:hypothetical protein
MDEDGQPMLTDPDGRLWPQRRLRDSPNDRSKRRLPRLS